MAADLEIIRVEPGGREVPVGEAPSYYGAIVQVELSASRIPGQYAIVEKASGRRIELTLKGRRNPVDPPKSKNAKA